MRERLTDEEWGAVVFRLRHIIGECECQMACLSPNDPAYAPAQAHLDSARRCLDRAMQERDEFTPDSPRSANA